MHASGPSSHDALSKRRAQFAGPSGVKGLLQNKKMFAIAVFASLGGFVYGYNQGMFGQILTMTSFSNTVHPDSISNTVTRGLLTAILELGAWVGVLVNGYTADKLGRKLATVVGVVVFVVGVIVQACAKNADYIYGGRFVTGLGVGTLSMVVPLYNAELAPAELRGSLVSLQQLAICFGIMVSYWIGYGTNYIGGTGKGQSNAAWLVPICIQILPAFVLGVGIMFMPQSPRWLLSNGKEEESLRVLSNLRRLPKESELVQLEYLEIKAQHMFEVETSIAKFPDYQSGSLSDNFKLGFYAYASLLTNRSLRKRVFAAVMIMVFQQWSGINAILYYAAFIFQDLGLTGNTTSLLAGGVGGILLFLATIPAVLYIDQLGRKPVLIVGALGMGISHLIVAGLDGAYNKSWPSHVAAGWVAVVFVWIYQINFGYSWGPGAWVVVAEVFPLGVRAKGISIGASSNWLNNFAIGQATPPMVQHMGFGTFIFFGLMCFIGAAFIYFVVPETKNLTLEEMDEVFGDEAGNAMEDRIRLDRIYGELGLFSDSSFDESDHKFSAVGVETKA
ncbi:general substrate transporter-3 [Coleophoma crateriformis]|uniref:General substrate transporter-3 n=1 Tax=Coleophoma crateriformis TaxID=565419 RepID=A0A3D8RV72_9HELO|nr:general substrate transporter-3 [Coleophoma crateriformis]